MNIVVISHMYPRKNRKFYGTFVSEQVGCLVGGNKDVSVSVVSPVQSVPGFLATLSDKWRSYRETEKMRTDFGRVLVFFPRFLCPPRKILRTLASRSALINIERDKKILSLIQKSDVIVAHTALLDGQIARLIAKKYRKDYFVYIHGEDIFQNTFGISNIFKRHNISKVLKDAKGVITVSSNMKNRIDEAYGTGGKSFINHNGVDLDIFDPEPKNLDGQLSIISASFLIPRKGHRYLLEALKELKESGTSFTCEIASDGSEKPILEKMSYDFGLTPEIIFSGYYDHKKEFPKMLSNHQLFVLPSWDEAFGVVYVEAMAMGLPVVAANDAGAPDIVSDGVDGYLVPPKDAKALAAKIKKYASLTTKEKEKMSEAAKLKAAKFSWSESANRLLKIIEAQSE